MYLLECFYYISACNISSPYINIYSTLTINITAKWATKSELMVGQESEAGCFKYSEWLI